MTTIYFVRHGEADYRNVPMRDATATSPDLAPLSAFGRMQIETLARDYRLAEVQAILTSSYARALESAALLSRAVGAPLYVEVDLHEWIPPSRGPDGRVDVATLRAAADDPEATMDIRGGERLVDVRRRTLEVLQRYRTFERLAVVTHAVTIASVVGPRAVQHAEIVEYRLDAPLGVGVHTGLDDVTLVHDDGVVTSERG